MSWWKIYFKIKNHLNYATTKRKKKNKPKKEKPRICSACTLALLWLKNDQDILFSVPVNVTYIFFKWQAILCSTACSIYSARKENYTFYCGADPYFWTFIDVKEPYVVISYIHKTHASWKYVLTLKRNVFSRCWEWPLSLILHSSLWCLISV